MGTSFRYGSFQAIQLIRLLYSDPCGSMIKAPHLLLYQFLMSWRTRYSSIFDFPVPVEPQMYRWVARMSGVISRGRPLPSMRPSFRPFPGMRLIDATVTKK